MNKMTKYALWGFAFGTLGLYLLALIALTAPVFETVSSLLMKPGRMVAEAFVDSEGSNGEVLLLTLFNGLFYLLIFILIGVLAARVRREER